ncbi:MAG: hypothetical protein J5523_02005 [Muribaculaceae bacterium]|nr:hypothetical protein [Muribaculaceae bacterium]
MKVTFQYYSESEDGRDDYRFTDEAEALKKFESLKEIIEVQFADCRNAEIVDEPDFFGIIDHTTGDWAKVIISTKN